MSFPDVPSCWSWDLPPLPQPAHLGPMVSWQAGRCAVCGLETVLVEDHDHDTGDTRGYLCARCNTAEGARWAPPVFALYRERHPAAMIGTLHRYGRGQHPVARSADIAWECALDDLRQHAMKDRPIHSRLPTVTPLMRAAMRVGITQAEWFETLGYRRDAEWDVRRGDEVRPHPLLERLRVCALFAACRARS